MAFKIGVIADPHLSLRGGEASWHNPYRLADAHERLDQALGDPLFDDVDVLALLGDLAHFGDRPSIQRCIEAVDKARHGRPAVVISGNHDVLEDDVHVDDELREFAPAFDAAATFASAGLGCTVHDVVALTSRQLQPFEVRSRTLVDSGPNGHVALTHFPILSFEDRARDAQLLYAAHLAYLAPPVAPLPDTGPVVVLSGHLHLRGVAHDANVLQLAFAALVEPPYELAVVEIDGDGGDLTVEYRCMSVREPDAEKLPILDPSTGRWRWTAGRGWHQAV